MVKQIWRRRTARQYTFMDSISAAIAAMLAMLVLKYVNLYNIWLFVPSVMLLKWPLDRLLRRLRTIARHATP